jgi:hypothetical protein
MAAPRLNKDGVSIAGCSIIYAPAGQAGEYSPLAVNPYRGCGHKCAYCYVPRIPGQPDRAEFDAGAILKPDYIAKLRRDAAKYRELRSTGQVMMSFTSDPYHPGDTSTTRQVFEILIDHGLGICALTKGGTRALRDLDLFRPERDAFASTLTTLDDDFSKKWERDAALPHDRMNALRSFHERDIFTWVSLEPTLSAKHSLAIVDATHKFVDLYKVGKANYIKNPDLENRTPAADREYWRDYTLRMIDKLLALGKKHYIKNDLQIYLPPDYPNPLRVPQHH